MRNSALLTALLFSLPNLLAGCQTTLGLSAPPANSAISIPKETHFLVYGSNDSPGWTKILTEFSHNVYGTINLVEKPQPHFTYESIKFIDDPNANFVFLRVLHTEPVLMNLLLIPGGLTLFIIPGFGYETYTADFEVYLAQNHAHDPTKLHYEFSVIRGIWLLNPASIRADSSYSIRALYSQFFSDYAKLLNNSAARGDKHE